MGSLIIFYNFVFVIVVLKTIPLYKKKREVKHPTQQILVKVSVFDEKPMYLRLIIIQTYTHAHTRRIARSKTRISICNTHTKKAIERLVQPAN